MAPFAVGGALLHIGVAVLAVFMGIILAKSFNLAGLFLMALGTVSNQSYVGFVVESNIFFHLDCIRGGGKSGSGESDTDK